MKIYVLYLLLINCLFAFCKDDLYKVLGVRRTATTQEIKKAYKSLAREWHPDKNKDPNAGDRFTTINEAYETLGDPERRRQYDQFGYTSARDQVRQPRPGGPFGGDPFDHFFRGFGGFNFGDSGAPDSVIEKYNINIRTYLTKFLPESHHKPSFIYSYAGFCFECAQIEPILERFIKELESVGIGVGTFNAQRSGSLTSELRITRVPALMAIVQGRLTYFKGHVTLHNLHDFVRNMFPANTVQQINKDNLDTFLDGWTDNHVRALMFSHKSEISARFLAPAFFYKNFVQFGHVNVKQADAGDIIKRFNINKHRETMLIFNEDTKSPIATISMQQLPRNSIDEMVEANKFLLLPRLSSQAHFEELCPEEIRLKRKKLCVVLITGKSDEQHRQSFRNYLQRSPVVDNNRVNFAYVYKETQHNVLRKLDQNDADVETSSGTLKIVILWRMERNHLRYEWLKTGWSLEEDQLPECEKTLEEQVNILLDENQNLAYKTELPEFYNEHARHLVIRIFYKLLHWYDRLSRYMTSFDGISTASIVMTLFFVFGMFYFMTKMAAIEEQEVREKQPKKYKPRPPSTTPDKKTVQFYELRPESYDNLVTNSDTGLTIVLLVNNDSKEKLLKKYGEIVYPLTRYSGLSFAFLQCEYYIGWFRHLLEQSANNRVILDHINIDNCIGTVLAINGLRNYYYIYKPKKARKWIRQTGKNVTSAIGLYDTDDNSDSDSGKQIEMKVEDLLDGLSNWFDKVFDGSVRKIRVPYWPSLTVPS